MRRLFAALSLSFVLTAGTPQSTLHVSGLKEPAEILIDKWGVAHLYAKSAEDAFFLQGFNAARDRLFQIDLWRRRGLGKLSEVLGPAYVDQDRAARLFLYRGDMDEEWKSYAPDAQMIVAAFARGINSYIDWLVSNPDQMPLEFKLLGYRPEKWDPSDVVRIRSHGLTRNLTSEVARANLICQAGAEQGLLFDHIRVRLTPPWQTSVPAGLDPCLPKDVLKVFDLATRNVKIVRNQSHSSSAAALRVEFAEAQEEASMEGSNNWTIAPSKTTTGRPIVANDPQRSYSTPSIRYIVHLSAPGANMIGAGEPAVPGVSLGHNDSIATGLTIFEMDQEDLYVYDLNPSNDRQYRYKDAWEPMNVVHESIAVKGGAPVETDLVFTRHGPVIYTDATHHRAYAVRTCWLVPGTAPYLRSLSSMRTSNYADFVRANSNWGAPTLNLVYADVKGNIAWIARGRAPIRPNWDGLMPVPGDGRFEWQGFWSGEKLPLIYNPAKGWVSTSNEMNIPPDYPNNERKLGFEWAEGSRHSRIEEVIRSTPKVSIEDSMRLQNDVVSVPARRLVAVLAPLRSDDPDTKAALALLHGWDANERADSSQAPLMEVWLTRHLIKAYRDAVLPAKFAKLFEWPDVDEMLEALEAPDKVPGRDHLLLSTLADAYRETEKLLGPDSKKWQWGKLHTSAPEHVLSNYVDASVHAKIQPGPYPTAGDPFTPNASGYLPKDFKLVGGPSVRLVLDVGNWDNSRAVNYPGQSGDSANAHYSDLAPYWLKGDYFPLLYTRAAIEKATERKLILEPAK